LRTTITCLADAATISSDGKINILGEFNHIRSAGVPVLWPRMIYVARIEVENSDPDEVPIELRILNEDEEPIALPQTGGWRRNRPAPVGEVSTVPLLLEINNAVFPAFGTYQFVLLLAGEEHGRTLLYVVQRVPGGG
jgi:hypothetical protein